MRKTVFSSQIIVLCCSDRPWNTMKWRLSIIKANVINNSNPICSGPTMFHYHCLIFEHALLLGKLRKKNKNYTQNSENIFYWWFQVYFFPFFHSTACIIWGSSYCSNFNTNTHIFMVCLNVHMVLFDTNGQYMKPLLSWFLICSNKNKLYILIVDIVVSPILSSCHTLFREWKDNHTNQQQITADVT